MVHKIVEKVPDEQLQGDLDRYRQRALELGATDAKIITTDMVLIDERVRAKCIYPKCAAYGTNTNCPPYVMDLEQFRKTVSNFRYAVFTKLEVPSEEITYTRGRSSADHWRTKMAEIVAKIEAEAFYDGYYLALAFAGGSCKRIFCPDTDCSALVPGQPCRHPLRARAAMEAVGMDAFTMATKVGWDIYPIGRSSTPSEVPHGARLGLVLIC